MPETSAAERSKERSNASGLTDSELLARYGPKLPIAGPGIMPIFNKMWTASERRSVYRIMENFKENQLLTPEAREVALHEIETNRKDMKFADESTGALMAKILRCNYSREDGDALVKEEKYEEAISKYEAGMRALLGPETVLPTKWFLNESYLDLFEGSKGWNGALDTLECSAKIMQCYWKLGRLSEALEWFGEMRVIYMCIRLIKHPDLPPWMHWHLPVLEYYTIRMKAAYLASEIYASLGNTGSAWFFGYKGIGYPYGCPHHPHFEDLTPRPRLLEMKAWRHPEPRIVQNLGEVTVPGLQIRGVWKKVEFKGKERPQRRHGHCGWVWKGKWYVVGGQYDLIGCLEDMWCLDLKTFQWRKLPDFPDGINHRSGGRVFNNNQMFLWNDAAWRFIGETAVWKFDLVTERWSRVPCKLKSGQKWPYAGTLVQEYAATLLGDNMYIFGGDDENTFLGTNIFVQLNLRTHEWTHLGGISDFSTNIRYPFLRDHAAMWAIPDQNRVYLLYGNVDRGVAGRQGKAYGSDKDYVCEDMWSNSLDSNEWRRERLRGNFPCPRTEMACAYHPTLDRVIVYGGYNGAMPTLALDKNPPIEYTYSFYGDTFLMDPSTGIWQQVLVRGFPSYRAQAQLFVDDETGKIYLHGGYTNSSFVPSKHHLSRTFQDVWHLALNCEGGWLSPEELKRDSDSSQLGPWRLCATCCNAGTSLRKCGGTCGGKVSYCSTECQKDGWKTHKANDGCGKK